MKTREREKDSRDSILLLLLILLVGFICIIVTSGWALRFSPSWKLPANMRSNLNPDSDFLTSRPSGFYEPIDPSILTPPDWVNVFLTPGSTFLTRTPGPKPPQASNTPAVTLTNTTILTVTASPTNVVAPTNTLIYFPPQPATATSTKKPKPPAPTATAMPATPTATSVPPLSADLSITKTDNATDYAANGSITYIIVASNAGPDPVTSATVTDTFSGNLNLTGVATWTCTASPGASCNAGSSNLNDTVVLPVGGSVQYTVNVTASSSPTGSLTNSATISSGVADPNPGNNTASDSDNLISASALTSPVGNIPSGTFADYSFGTPFVVGPGSSLIYYPQYSSGATVSMDLVILQLGDGKNWFTILNWGDGSTGNNGDISSLAPCGGSETDNCPIPIAGLTNPGPPPGITITGLPAGTYPYIRIISPPDSGDGVDINNIVEVP